MRRLEIRIMKRAGYTREKWILIKNKRGDLVPQNVKRDGEITDPDDNPIGRDWPLLIPARAKAKTVEQKRAYNGADRRGRIVHALRRSKRSEEWLKRRAEQRTAKGGEQ